MAKLRRKCDQVEKQAQVLVEEIDKLKANEKDMEQSLQKEIQKNKNFEKSMSFQKLDAPEMIIALEKQNEKQKDELERARADLAAKTLENSKLKQEHDALLAQLEQETTRLKSSLEDAEKKNKIMEKYLNDRRHSNIGKDQALQQMIVAKENYFVGRIEELERDLANAKRTLKAAKEDYPVRKSQNPDNLAPEIQMLDLGELNEMQEGPEVNESLDSCVIDQSKQSMVEQSDVEDEFQQ